MKTIANFQFPENVTEAKQWQSKVFRTAIHHQILVVGNTRQEGMWSAYVEPVPGMNHDNEWGHVLKHGSKLIEPIARAIFPEMRELPYAK